MICGGSWSPVCRPPKDGICRKGSVAATAMTAHATTHTAATSESSNRNLARTRRSSGPRCRDRFEEQCGRRRLGGHVGERPEDRELAATLLVALCLDGRAVRITQAAYQREAHAH